jgi:hypothetical protein
MHIYSQDSMRLTSHGASILISFSESMKMMRAAWIVSSSLCVKT